MNVKVAACLFTTLESLLMAGQITTLISTYWTSWNLRFNWTEVKAYGRGPQTDGQLVSEGHAGLWSRCLRIYDTSRGDDLSTPYNCLHNYNTSNGSFRYEFGKACKIATAALCIADAVLIVLILITVLMSAFRYRGSKTMCRISLPLLLFQGTICFAIPLTYLSGNMAELIDQLSTAYGLLRVVHMSAWYAHDWAFWLQVALIGVWTATVAVFVMFYSLKYAQICPKSTTCVKVTTADDSELQSLKD